MKSVILAGGSGSRLWPLSRDMYPKQLFSFEKDISLVQQTYSRLLSLSEVNDIATITNVKYYTDIKLQLNKIHKNNIVIAEPSCKNTAAAIASAIKYFKQASDKDELILIVPSDLLISDNDKFYESIAEAKKFADANYIVTFGIKPTYPETGFGYIKAKNNIVVKFVEKPDSQTAQKYCETGDYYWNGGIFLGKISVFAEEFKKYSPEIYSAIYNFDFINNLKIPYELYEELPAISIDYSVMEKSDKIALVELKSDWKDVGSWRSLYDVKEKDSDGNVITGKVITDNVKNSFIYSQKELVAVADLEDVVIVETEDAIMACKMDKTQDVKKLYEKLKTQQSDTTKLHKTVFRPWGYYTCMNSGEGYLTKTICVLPKQKLSIQSHNHRSEHWVVLEGKALVVKDDEKFYLNAGDSIDIPIKAKHSLQNPYDEELKIIEVQKGDYISEDDIIRYEDCYGRV